MKLCILLLSMLLLTGCSQANEQPTKPVEATETATQSYTEATSPQTEFPSDPIQQLLNEMSVEELVGQLFLARCDSVAAKEHIKQYHLGGLVFFAVDFEGHTPESFRKTLADYQSSAAIPLLCAVDEEGGDVTRISRFPAFRDSRFPSPRNAFAQGGFTGLMENEEEKCILLYELGLNVNLGPLCDISTAPNAFMYRRSLGQDPDTTARYVEETVLLMNTYSIGSVLKHYPGYGNNADTHIGVAVDNRSLAELASSDLIPFYSGISSGCGAVMVSHTIVQALDDTLPASLSPAVIGYLRRNMGFTGVIMTDDLSMDAIVSQYGAGEAAVLAVLAGNDMLLSTDYTTQYEAVLDAVLSGRIDYFQVQDSVRRILIWKQRLGLL